MQSCGIGFRIVLADSYRMFHETLLAQIRATTGNAHILAVSKASDLVAICRDDRSANDMFVVDITMPGLGGSEGLCVLHHLQPEATIVAFGCPSDPVTVRALFDAGISACILRSMSSQTFAAALALAMNGERFFPAAIMLADEKNGGAPDSVSDETAGGDPWPLADGLTPRQREVLRHLCEGKSNKDIARALSVEEITVKIHLRAVFARLNVHNRTQAAIYAQRAGWFAGSADRVPPNAVGAGALQIVHERELGKPTLHDALSPGLQVMPMPADQRKTA